MMARAVIADDHPFFRQGLARLLGTFGIDVVAEASNGGAAIEAAQHSEPDVVVLDLNMPGLTGVEVIRLLAERAPASRVLVLSVSADEADVIAAIVAGAHGYVLKDDPVEEIVAGVRAVAAGESLVCPSIAAMLLRTVRERERTSSGGHHPLLTTREFDVLTLVVDGRTNDEIGDGLHIGTGTARNYVSSLLMKLDVHTRAQAAVRAVREGMV
jgi:DNA-binding NarL/FixJ family response regulator